MVDPDLMMMADDLRKVVVLIVAILGLVVIVTLGFYIIQCSAINKINKSVRGEGHILAWIPIANIWLYGHLCDVIAKEDKNRKYHIGIVCLLTCIVFGACVMYGIYTSSYFMYHISYLLYNLSMALATYNIARRFCDNDELMAGIFGIISIIPLVRLFSVIYLGSEANQRYMEHKEDNYL